MHVAQLFTFLNNIDRWNGVRMGVLIQFGTQIWDACARCHAFCLTTPVQIDRSKIQGAFSDRQFGQR